MKSLILYIYLVTIVFAFSSCKDYLDRSPLDTVTDGNLAFSVGEMEMYCNRFYTNMPGHVWYASNWNGDGGSDNMVPRTYNRWDGRFAGTVTVPESGGGWDFSGIRAVNYFLDNYKKSAEAIDVQKKYAGEIYFWKAWYYFRLMKRFGDLPWYTHTLETTSEELYSERISRSIVADSIIQMLDYAIDYLPLKDEAVVGRLHKDVALIFKARVALYEGTWEKYHENDDFKGDGRNYNRFFEQAIDAAGAIMNSERYEIYSSFTSGEFSEEWSYWSLFVNSSLLDNPEVILSHEYSVSQNLTHSGPQYGNEGGMDGNGISKSLMDSYLCSDGLPISISPLYKGDETVSDVMEHRDSRIWQTCMWEGCIKDARDNSTFTLPLLTYTPWPNTTGYQQYKYVPVLSTVEGHNQAITAFPIYRYAEALLIYAEAHAELGTCTQDVLDKSINILRDRVGMPHLTVDIGFVDPNWDYPNLSPLINEIRRERRVELALEDFRVDDLLRWAATDVIQKPLLGSKYAQWVDKPFNPPLEGILVNEEGYIAPYLNVLGNSGRPFNPSKNYLYPLPTSELVKNPNLKQNPGY